MSKDANDKKSTLPPEKSSTLTVNEILMLFIVITIAVFAIITVNMQLLLVDLIFVAFVRTDPTPSAFKEFLNMLINLLKTKGKL